MKKIGSQIRENIKETKYIVDIIEGDEQIGRNAYLYNLKTGKYELWTERDDFAGYVIEIDGIGYEFVREIGYP